MVDAGGWCCLGLALGSSGQDDPHGVRGQSRIRLFAWQGCSSGLGRSALVGEGCAQLHTGGCAACGRRVGGERQGSGWEGIAKARSELSEA